MIDKKEFIDKLLYWRDKDQAIIKDQDRRNRYNGMVDIFSMAGSQEELNKLAMVFIFDMTYERSDICLALHTVEFAKSWRSK